MSIRPSFLWLLAGVFILAALAYEFAGHGASEEHGRDTVRRSDKPVEVIHVGHIYLETETAIAAVGAAYEKLCRQRGENVRVVQMPVPARLYGTWFTTQLLGDDPPELLALHAGSNTERLARYFEPLTTALAVPNPYNAGTPLAGRIWRDTFPDGLPISYNTTLLEYYSVPLTNLTTRLVVNMDLYHEICGDDPWPQTYENFIRLCRKTQDFAKRTGRNITPIASSQFHAPVLFRLLVRTQTQKLAMEFNLTKSLRYTNIEQRLAYVDHKFSLRSPEIQDLLAMESELSGVMKPGFSQLSREDAAFYFVQGQALMMVSFSNSAQSNEGLIPFATAVHRIPVPTPVTPRYGKNILGQIEDKSFTSSFDLALTLRGRNKVRALDFLKFAASQRGNQIFCDQSHWFPSVEGVAPWTKLTPYRPDTAGGYLLGFDLSSFDITRAGDTEGVISSNLHLLAIPDRGPERFVEAIRADYDRTMRSDAAKEAKDSWDNVERYDTMIALLDRLAMEQGGDSLAYSHKRNRLWEASLEQESWALFTQKTLAGGRRE